MELTRTDTVFSRIAMVLFLCRNKSSRNDLKINGDYFLELIKNIGERIHVMGPTPFPRGWGRAYPPGGAPCLVGPLELHRPQVQLHIFVFGEKKIRQKDSSRFTIRSCRLLFFIGRADLESIRSFGAGESSPSSSPTLLHHQFRDAHRRA